MKRKLYLTMLPIVAALVLAPAALAQINPVVDDGDNIDPSTGQVVGDDTPDCERPEDVLESGLCRSSETDPAAGTDQYITTEETAGAGTDQYTTTEETTATTGGKTAEETTAEETISGGGTEEEKTRRERREKQEKTGGGAGETTAQGGGTTGSDGEQGGSGNGGYQGGLALAINDGLGNISRGRLPSTGGGWAVLLIAGAVLIGGGWLLVRRFSSR